jgi:hypothetical protein
LIDDGGELSADKLESANLENLGPRFRGDERVERGQTPMAAMADE